MKRLTDEQKDYLAFLPQTLTIKNLTQNAQLLLGKLMQVFYSNNEEPYFYVTDREIKNDVGIDFKGIDRARTLLIARRLIFYIKGVPNVASHYILLFDDKGEAKELDKSLKDELIAVVEEKKRMPARVNISELESVEEENASNVVEMPASMSINELGGVAESTIEETPIEGMPAKVNISDLCEKRQHNNNNNYNYNNNINSNNNSNSNHNFNNNLEYNNNTNDNSNLNIEEPSIEKFD